MSRRPLAGVRVVITRAARQATATADAFADAGAEVALLPLIEVGPPDDPAPLARALAELDVFDAVAFTSANAVAAVLPSSRTPPRPTSQGSTPPIAAVGPATAAAVRAAGHDVVLEAARRDAAGLAAALAARFPPGARVLLPQADDARPELARGLAAAGLRPHAVVAYAKRLPAGAAERARELFATGPLGLVVFTSPRIVRVFVSLLGDAWPRRRAELRAVAIGETTAGALRDLHVAPTVASEPTPEALVAAAVAAKA